MTTPSNPAPEAVVPVQADRDANAVTEGYGAVIDALVSAAWNWGHDCDVDDLHRMDAVGDSHNEGQRFDVGKRVTSLKNAIRNLHADIDAMRTSRDNTRAALEAMRKERDAVLSTPSPLPVTPTPEMAEACRNCAGEGWVCENHRDRPWEGGGATCCGGAGAPCGVCNAAIASAPFTHRLYEALNAVIARAPSEKPEGPYDPLGGYSSDNFGDVISDATDAEAWACAEICRAALLSAAPASQGAGEARLRMLLEILSAAGGRDTVGEGCWIDAFCEDHEKRDPDTLNTAIDRGLISSSFNSMFETSTIEITKAGREFLATPPASPEATALDGGAK